MLALRAAVLGLFALVLVGCSTPSLNPLASADTTLADPGIVGEWIDDSDKPSVYAVTAAGDTKYHLAGTETGGKGEISLDFTLVRLDGVTYADLTMPKTDFEKAAQRHGTTVVPAHVFVRLARDGDTLTIRPLNDDWLQDGLKAGTIALAHAKVDDTMVLTASTEDLQKFFKANKDKLWKADSVTTLKRRAAK